MFCPDCGRESPETDRFCPICGFPLDRLRKQISDDEKASLGWADKIIGKPDIKPAEPKEPPLISYATGSESPRKKEDDEKHGYRCERCGVNAGVGTLCPACGETLPSLVDNDPYLSLVFKNVFRMIIAPRHYAVRFPYPVTGGLIQPLLWPGVFAALFVLTLPLGSADAWMDKGDPTRALIPAFVGIPIYVLATPILVYLSCGLIYFVAKLLGGTTSLRRTVRVFSGGLIILLIYGILRNFSGYVLYMSTPDLHRIVPPEIDIRMVEELIRTVGMGLLVTVIIFIGWQFAWAFGGLNRLSWWKSLLLVLATYVPVLWWLWLYTLVLLPLHAGGLL